MYGLYLPHGSLRVRHEGPAALIRPNGFQTEQLERHRKLLMNTGGAPVTAALKRGDGAAAPPFAVKFVVSADAATDSGPPGIGGFCHGLYWYVPIPEAWLVYMHITVLELLATGMGAIALAPYLRHAQRIRLQSDALATPFVLSRHGAHSPTLMLAHHQLLQDDRYLAVAANADIQHLDGDSNAFSDSVSRALWERFRLLCRAANIQPVRVQVPEHALALLRRVADAARLSGVRIRRSQYVRPDPVLPPAMLMLGRRATACEEADAVAKIGARLAAALRVAMAPPRRPSHGGQAARIISERLAGRLRGEPAVVLPERPTTPPPHASSPSGAPPVRAPRGRTRTTQVEARPLAARQDKLSLTTIGKLRLLALPRPAAAAPSRAHDALRAAAGVQAHRRAALFANAGFGSNHNVDQLAELLKHASDLRCPRG